MDLSGRSTVFKVAAAALVVAVALMMLFACYGDIDMMMPMAMLCVAALTAVIAIRSSASKVRSITAFVPPSFRPVSLGRQSGRAVRAGPRPLLLTGVLRV